MLKYMEHTYTYVFKIGIYCVYLYKTQMWHFYYCQIQTDWTGKDRNLRLTKTFLNKAVTSVTVLLEESPNPTIWKGAELLKRLTKVWPHLFYE